MEGRGLDSYGSATRPSAFSCKHGMALSGPREDGLLGSRETAGSHKRLCLTLRRLMSYIYGAPILDVSRSHTTTQHSR